MINVCKIYYMQNIDESNNIISNATSQRVFSEHSHQGVMVLLQFNETLTNVIFASPIVIGMTLAILYDTLLKPVCLSRFLVTSRWL